MTAVFGYSRADPSVERRGPGAWALTLSALFHLCILLAAFLGLPSLMKPPLKAAAPGFEVELVAPPALETTAPPMPKDPPEAAPVGEVSPAPVPEPQPEPEPQVVAEPEPEPQPMEKTPEPEPQPAAAPPPQPAPSPEKSAPPAPEKQPDIAAQAKVKSPEKPQPPQDFASVLKTVEKLQDPAGPSKRQRESVKEKPQPPRNLSDILSGLQPDRPPVADPTPAAPMPPDPPPVVALDGVRLARSELDAVKRQIAGCWNIQPGALDAQNLIIRLRVALNPDGGVRSADILTDGSERGNPFWAAAARSARTAVLKCSPLKLPPEKYELWRVINFTFDPKEMFGS